MTLDQRLAQAVHHVADGVAVPDVDLDAVRIRARANRLRMVAVAATVAVVTASVAGTAIVAGRDTNSPMPPSGTTSPSEVETGSATLVDDLDTGTWQTYRSDRYGFTMGHPPNWSEASATRDWTWESDSLEFATRAQENFHNQYGDVGVSAWSVPLDRGTRMDSTADLVDWVENYCERSGIGPCDTVADHAVPLCVEARDCHPGLLVPFHEDTQAFFSGGIYPDTEMTVVAVWRNESHATVLPYGGARRLLEAFLSTMQVWPRSTPPEDRR